MEQLQNFGEQPADQIAPVANARVEQIGQDSIEGSPIDKFKNATKLLEAYNSLQSEFTKKCQRVKEIEQEMQDNTDNKVPCYQLDEWQSILDNFNNNYKDAKKFYKEIANEIIEDKELAYNKNSLELAYAKVLSRHYKSQDEIFNDHDQVIQKVLSDKTLTDKLLKKYMENYKKSPQLISSKVGGVTGLNTNVTPTSLSQAKELVAGLFK